jgi:hypothetical protein
LTPLTLRRSASAALNLPAEISQARGPDQCREYTTRFDAVNSFYLFILRRISHNYRRTLLCANSLIGRTSTAPKRIAGICEASRIALLRRQEVTFPPLRIVVFETLVIERLCLAVWQCLQPLLV